MKLWVILASLAVFAAGFAAGAAAFRSPARSRGHRDEPFPFWGRDPFATLVTSEKVYSELGLDEQQKRMITYLLTAHEKNVREHLTGLDDLRTKLREGIDAALSEEQRKRLAAIQEEVAESELRLRVNQDLASLKQELQLTEEEETKLQQIFLDYEHTKKEVWQSGPGRDHMAQGQEIRKKRDEKVKEVLAAEKFTKYQELKGRQHRGPDRGFPPPPPPQ